MFRQVRFLACLGLAAGFVRAAQPLPVPDYKVGETARVDVIAAVPLVAVDPEKTDALRQKEAQRVPVIYRLNTNAVAEAVARLHEAFATNRFEFITRVRTTFNRPVVEERALTNQRFRRLVGTFQNSRRGFPMSSNLAVAWARGEAEAPFIAPLEEKLTNAMARFIRPEDSPPEAKIGYQVKVIRTDAVSPITADEIERTRSVPRSNVIALARARTEFAKQFAPEEKVVSRFLAPMIQPTCLAEAAWTRELREKALAGLSSVNRHEPGDAIVRAGEVVTAGTKAALDEYRARLALLRPPETPPPIAPWLWAAGIALAGLTIAAIVWVRARRRTMALALVPESLGQETVAALRNDPVIRARLLEHFTRLLGNTVVQRLFAQRGQLLDTQRAAAAQTAELEERLEKVQSDMQHRFAAYEQRIADLEKELAAAEEQNRDLIRAKIAIAKQELEAERAKSRVGWN